MNDPEENWETGILGDSISHGGGRMSYSPADWPYNYAYYLDFPTMNMSRSGDETGDLLRRFDADVLPFHVQYLLIMGGTNNLRGGGTAEKVILTWRLFRKMQIPRHRACPAYHSSDRPGKDFEILPPADGGKLESGI